jgi:LuxR family maltose regulon positive regulatory protein
LLDQLPPTVQLVLATRSDPPLPLARMRVQGALHEVREADLRFSADETDTFLTAAGVRISQPGLTALYERTEGWIAGLQLVALALQRHADPEAFITGFTGSHRFVLDYLSEEVLSREDEQTRTFLLQTAILERLDPDLCRAVTGTADSHAMLDRLSRRNLFLIPLDATGQVYRYHHLFADLLQMHLRQSRAAELPELHTRAAGWYRANDEPLLALRHYLAGTQHQAAAELVEQEALTLFNRGDLPAVVGLIGRLPVELARRRPWLNAFSGFFLTLSGRVEEGELALGLAQETQSDPNLTGFIATTRVHVLCAQLQLQQAAEQARMALDMIEPEYPFIRCYAGYGLGKALLGLEQLDAARAALAQAFAISEAHSHIVNIVPVLSLLAQIDLLQNDLTSADMHLRKVQHFTDQHRAATSRVAAFWLAAQAQLLLAQGQREAALAQAELATNTGLKHHNPFSAIQGWLAQAEILSVLERFDAAASLLTQARELQRNHPVFRDLAALIALQEAQLALQQGDAVTAAARLADCDPGDSRLIAGRRRQVQAAIAALQSGSPVAATGHPALVEQLSARELEVLQLIAAGLPNGSIAERLMLSLSTVKKHSSSIFGKLDVANRTQAVARARELGIL